MAPPNGSSDPVRIRLSVLHAAFDPERRVSFTKLHETLLQECAGLEDRIDLHVYREVDPRGSLLPWLGIMRDGVARAEADRFPDEGEGFVLDTGYPPYPQTGAECRALGRFAPTHLAFLPDDVTLGKGFARALLAIAENCPGDLIDLLTNHSAAPKMRADGARYYVTRDAWNGFGLMPVEMAAKHLMWRRGALLLDGKHEAEGGKPVPGRRIVQHDEGVSLWAMQHRIPIVKPLPGLVQHEEPAETLDDSHVGFGRGVNEVLRKSVCFEPETDLAKEDWSETKKIADAGRSMSGTHWSLVFDLAELTESVVERAYECDREGGFFPVKSPESKERITVDPQGELCDEFGVHLRPHVFISVPEYQPALAPQRTSLMMNVATLRKAGTLATTDLVTGQSLVTRARNWGCVHRFMKSRANVLFQWDGDVEAVAPNALHLMLPLCEKYGVVAGAYPFRDGSGKPCATLPRTPGSNNPLNVQLAIEEDLTCAAHEVATGFLMVHRRVLVQLMARFPELLHQQDGGPEIGAPAWALFDTRIVDNGRGRRGRYLSEDWEFSRLCREIGVTPRLYVPLILRHWGITPCDGHIQVFWNDKPWEEVYGKPYDRPKGT